MEVITFSVSVADIKSSEEEEEGQFMSHNRLQSTYMAPRAHWIMAGILSALQQSILKLRLWVQILSVSDWLYEAGQLNLAEARFPQW